MKGKRGQYTLPVEVLARLVLGIMALILIIGFIGMLVTTIFFQQKFDMTQTTYHILLTELEDLLPGDDFLVPNFAIPTFSIASFPKESQSGQNSGCPGIGNYCLCILSDTGDKTCKAVLVEDSHGEEIPLTIDGGSIILNVPFIRIKHYGSEVVLSPAETSGKKATGEYSAKGEMCSSDAQCDCDLQCYSLTTSAVGRCHPANPDSNNYIEIEAGTRTDCIEEPIEVKDTCAVPRAAVSGSTFGGINIFEPAVNGERICAKQRTSPNNAVFECIDGEYQHVEDCCSNDQCSALWPCRNGECIPHMTSEYTEPHNDDTCRQVDLQPIIMERELMPKTVCPGSTNLCMNLDVDETFSVFCGFSDDYEYYILDAMDPDSDPSPRFIPEIRAYVNGNECKWNVIDIDDEERKNLELIEGNDYFWFTCSSGEAGSHIPVVCSVGNKETTSGECFDYQLAFVDVG